MRHKLIVKYDRQKQMWYIALKNAFKDTPISFGNRFVSYYFTKKDAKNMLSEFKKKGLKLKA